MNGILKISLLFIMLGFSNAVFPQWDSLWEGTCCEPSFTLVDFSAPSDSTIAILGWRIQPWQDPDYFVLISEDCGLTFDTTYVYHFANIRSISFPTNEVGYLCSYRDTNTWDPTDPGNLRKLVIWKTTDSGETWAEIFESEFDLDNSDEPKVDFINDNVGFVNARGIVYSTFDGGYSWELFSDSNPGNQRSTATFDSIYAFASEGMYQYTKMPFEEINSVQLFNGNEDIINLAISLSGTDTLINIIARGFNGLELGYPQSYYRILVTGPINGSDFTIQHSIDLPFVDIERINDNIFLATSNGIEILKSEDAGETWFVQEVNPSGGGIRKIKCVNDSLCFAIRYSSNLFKTNNSGGESSEEISDEFVYVDVEEFASLDIINVFPNPASEVLKIDSEFPFNSVEIIDAKGRLVFQQSFRPKNVLQIDTSRLNNGFYILNIMSAKGVQHIRIVIGH